MFEMPQPERPANELREVREKRLAMRSMRRGIKEDGFDPVSVLK